MNRTPAVSADYQKAVSSGMGYLARGNLQNAMREALHAIQIDARAEEAWLLLAATAPAEKRAPYLHHILELNPASDSARRALHELSAHPPSRHAAATAIDPPTVETILGISSGSGGLPPATAISSPSESASPPPPRKRSGFRWSVALVSLSCMAALLITSFANAISFAQQPPVLARIEKSYGTALPSFTPSFTPSITPSFTPTYTPTNTPTPTFTPSPTYPPTNTPLPTVYIPPPPAGSGGERWIDVDISSQTLTAYEGNTPLRSFLVSTGVAQHPTVLGRYRIYIKLRYTTMAGPGYYLPNVPYTMYFYKGYSIHGTYWHSNFGTPMSHGCVNMYTPHAAWMFDFASVGTVVYVHW